MRSRNHHRSRTYRRSCLAPWPPTGDQQPTAVSTVRSACGAWHSAARCGTNRRLRTSTSALFKLGRVAGHASGVARHQRASAWSSPSTVSTVMSACLARRNCSSGATSPLLRSKMLVLFFAEFTYLRRHHRVISGCEFQKLPHGPAPRQLLPVRQRLIDSGAAELVEEDFLGRPQYRLVPLRAANLDVFTDEELQTIEDVLGQLDGMTGTQVSELSHQEPGWRLTEVGETIPFSTAFLDFPQVQTPTSERLSESVAERYNLATA